MIKNRWITKNFSAASIRSGELEKWLNSLEEARDHRNEDSGLVLEKAFQVSMDMWTFLVNLWDYTEEPEEEDKPKKREAKDEKSN